MGNSNSIPSLAATQLQCNEYYKRELSEKIRQCYNGESFVKFTAYFRHNEHHPVPRAVIDEFRDEGYYVEYDEEEATVTISWEEGRVKKPRTAGYCSG